MAKTVFTTKIDGKDVEFKIININNDIRMESQKHYAKAFHEGLDAGLMLRIEVEKMLEKKNLLDTSKEEKKIADLSKQIKSMEVELRKGVVGNKRMTKEQGKKLALSIRAERAKLNEIGNSLSKYFNNTVETTADNERLQYFLYSCTVFADTGERFWKSFDQFKSDNDHGELVTQATKLFMSNLLGIDGDSEKTYYENQWLMRMGFMDSKYRLIDENGRLVNDEGRWINEEGYYVNENYEIVDSEGNKIDKDGQLLEDSWGLTPTVVETEKEKAPIEPVTTV